MSFCIFLYIDVKLQLKMLSFLWLNTYGAKSKNIKKSTLIPVTYRILFYDYTHHNYILSIIG